MQLPAHLIQYYPPVAEALQAGRPVVALESTIIAHGMPYPQNVETAEALGAIIEAEGATPATLAIMDGKIRVGLDLDDLKKLATSTRVLKASRRDIPLYLSQGELAATTVAATMILANLAGIRVFATGGIGGVHRGAETNFDISADLTELSQTPVAVVSAGVKAILDIGLTLEYLETLGVPVVSYGTDDFPAFYSPDSGFLSPARLDKATDIAQMLRTQWQLGYPGGALIANPIPAEYALPRPIMDQAIEQALTEAQEQQIGGKDLTPFLLDRIKTLTAGQSLASNIELVKHNARLAAKIAVAMANKA